MSSGGSALIRLEKSPTPEDLRTVVRELIDWLKTPEQTSLRRAFAVWLGRVLLPRKLPGQRVPEVADLQEVDTMLTESVQEWTKQWQAKGWTKGWAKGMGAGRQEGEATLLQRLLHRRFGSLPGWVPERLHSADQATLESWGDRVLEAHTLDDVFRE